jgi:hypothetical protein
MQPVIAQLEREGFDVRRVNIDEEPALKERHNVGPVPTFIVVDGPRELARFEGTTSLAELRAALRPPGVRHRSDGFADLASDVENDESGSIDWPADDALGAGGDASRRDQPVGPGRQDLLDRLMAASVRLKVVDPQGNSWGSGTIIDAADGEALILSCAHVFRDSDGKGEITVDLFGPDAPRGLQGELVSYDLKADVALVSIRTHARLEAVPVAPAGYRVRKGDRVVSIGCNNGQPPTSRESHVTSLDKFLGPPNLQVAGQPVSGRSGGGLFSADGYVIGVCNAADPTDDEGLYAALGAIHSELDRADLAFIYREQSAGADADLLAEQEPTMPEQMPEFAGREQFAATQERDSTAPPRGAGMSDAERGALDAIVAQEGSAEVICIIRSLDDPRAKSEIIVLDRASPEFLQQLGHDRTRQAARQLTQRRDKRSASRTAKQPWRAAR